MVKYCSHILSLIIMLFICSCTSDQEVVLTNKGELTFELTLPFKESSRGDEEVGEDALNENLLEKLDLFFYDGNSLVWYVPEGAFQISSIGEGNKKALRINTPNEIIEIVEKKELLLVAIGNGPERSRLASKSLTELTEVVVQSSTFNGDNPQSSFVMEGKLVLGGDSFISSESNHLGTLSLTRVAAKIRLIINDIAIKGYHVNSAKVNLLSYLDKTTLLNTAANSVPQFTNDYKDSSDHGLEEVEIEGERLYTTHLPFYSYENSWVNNEKNETYLLITVMLSEEDYPDYPIAYYYKVAISTLVGFEQQKIRRNTHYEITVTINELGDTRKEYPFELENSIKMKAWNKTDPIFVEMNKDKYLFIKEYTMSMVNTAERNIEYISNSPINLLGEVKASFIGYRADETSYVGKPKTLPKVSFITLDNKKYINVTNPIPTNYLPLHIEFTVTNKTNRTETIKIIQYPSKYVTLEKSVEKWNKNNCYASHFDTIPLPGHAVTNMFRITTLIPPKEGSVGDPVDNEGFTKNSVEANKIVSPEFIVASKLIRVKSSFFDYDYSSTSPWESAQKRCSKYYEKDYGPGRKFGGRWRVPTRYEIEYMSHLNDYALVEGSVPSSPSSYWCAETYHYYNFTNKTWRKTGKYHGLSIVRCVYDVYKYENRSVDKVVD